jgi:hypothetical protein
MITSSIFVDPAAPEARPAFAFENAPVIEMPAHHAA